MAIMKHNLLCNALRVVKFDMSIDIGFDSYKALSMNNVIHSIIVSIK